MSSLPTERRKEFDDVRCQNKPYELNFVEKRLFNRPINLMRLLRRGPFCHGLPGDEILGDTNITDMSI